MGALSGDADGVRVRDAVRPARAVWAVAAAFVGLELAVSARYGFHRDELYFVVAGRHPAFGYVDQPPLAPLLARAATGLFGTSPTAVRLLPALLGGVVVVCAGVTARLLGGSRAAQVLAAVATACAPVLLAASHLAGTTVYDLVAWAVTIAAALAAVVHRQSHAWLVAGAAVGLGMEAKDLVALLVVALGAGLVVTGRAQLIRDRWLWAGAALAVVLALPNLVWQARHGWPQLEMSRVLRARHSAFGDYLTVVPAEFVYAGLAASAIAVIGARALWRSPPLRWLAVAAALLLGYVLVLIPGRPYYVAGLLPAVFAAGATSVAGRSPTGTIRRVWFAAPAIGALLALPVVLPVLPESVAAGIGGLHKLNYDMGETVGWPQLADTVTGVYDRLPAADRATATVFAGNYGEAAALEVYAGERLPPVLSGHTSYADWRPRAAATGTVIAVGAVEQLRPLFDRCRQAATWHSPHGFDNDENGVPIAVCTGPHGSWAQWWPQLSHLG